jgi:hypothetical protein
MTADWGTRIQATDDGHLLWTGLTHKGTPILTNNHHRSIRRDAYAQHHGRTPVGPVRATCEHQLCMRGDHLSDQNDRQRAYQQVAEHRGLPTRSGYCNNGHPWADTAVFQADGRRRCDSCIHGEPPVDHSVSIEITITGRPEELPRRDQMEAVRRLICHRGATHEQVAHLVGRSPRTVSRWAARYGWRKAVSC